MRENWSTTKPYVCIRSGENITGLDARPQSDKSNIESPTLTDSYFGKRAADQFRPHTHTYPTSCPTPRSTMADTHTCLDSYLSMSLFQSSPSTVHWRLRITVSSSSYLNTGSEREIPTRDHLWPHWVKGPNSAVDLESS
ncbi:hypothetical protein BaRGS_00023833 [Batillaria attramentaria]|uniref:Uncharacterized protein n=1 Tax=Batillaria attramentaria TaxID=370345 RepID=A0ABD0KCQ0_9CAEN